MGKGSRARETRKHTAESRRAEMLKEARKRKIQKITNWAIGLAIVLVLSAWLGYGIVRSNGYYERNTLALTVDGEKVMAVELNYYYNVAIQSLIYGDYADYLDQLGFDVSKPAESQDHPDYDDMTWGDYFASQAFDTIEQMVTLSKLAKAEGLTLSDDDRRTIDKAVENIKNAADENSVAVNRWLGLQYGKGMTVGIYRDMIERELLASKIYTQESDKLTYTAAQWEEEFGKNTPNYSQATFRSFNISLTLPADSALPGYVAPETTTAPDTTAPPADTTPATTLTEQQESVSESLAQVETDRKKSVGSMSNSLYAAIRSQAAEYIVRNATSQDEFTRLAKAFAVTQTEITAAEDDKNLSEKIAGDYLTYYQSADVTDWLLDSARTEGDVAVFYSDTTARVVYYIDSGRKTDPVIDVRHILVSGNFPSLTAKTTTAATEATSESQPGDTTAATTTAATTEQTHVPVDDDADAQAKAEEILDEFIRGAKTEEAFGELAKKYSADESSVPDGGLYKAVPKGYMVPPFEEWIFDQSRKSGDTGIVKTQYGYHIMYFVKSAPEWESLADTALRNADMSDWLEAKLEGVITDQYAKSMRYIYDARAGY